jgi:hypothetical protein
MTEEERQALLEKMRASIEAARKMTPEQARTQLRNEGFCDDRGRLSEAYGGRLPARS